MQASQTTSATLGISPEKGLGVLGPVDAFWRAANFLTVAQIFLRDNALLGEPLKPEHIKPRLLGHWGTCPGLSFVYAHLNRIIRQLDARILYIAGTGHGGAAVNACAYLEGAFHETYPDYPKKADGIARLVREFSSPGGLSSHVSPYTPGSLHEGGELGYSLAHAFGAVFDNPELVACCIVGDGEAETGPLAASWHSTKFLNPVRDGAVLPVLHLNEYKIAGPTVFAAMSRDELRALFTGYGYEPLFVEGDDPQTMHESMADALDGAFNRIRGIQRAARQRGKRERPIWPMIALRTPKGWTGPEELGGEPVEGNYRAHQVPLPEAATQEESLEILNTWMRSYRSEELFDEEGEPLELLRESLPRPERRMSFSPHADGGRLLRELDLPRWEDLAIGARQPGEAEANPAGTLGGYLRQVIGRNGDTFRLFSPDETESNRLGAVFDATDRSWQGPITDGDSNLAVDGRVVEALSEHLCQGWLEGYLLTGRHGLFSSYEAFIHIVDSMLNQYAKWLKVSKETGWRKELASLNYLLASHVWQQDHNGFTHQDPGFLDHVVNKKADTVRVYLPPDANSLLCVTEHCLKSRNYINVIVAGKQSTPCWLRRSEARSHCQRGLGAFTWASSHDGENPEIALACAGDVPTLEVIAASELLKEHAPELRFRVVNVVDLLALQSPDQHPHGMVEEAFEELFTRDRPVVFAFHGYPWLIHRLTYKRSNHDNFHVRGYIEEGTTTTPFDMRVLNRIDRYSLLKDVARYLPDHPKANSLVKLADRMLSRHRDYIRREGQDLPEVADWRWR